MTIPTLQHPLYQYGLTMELMIVIVQPSFLTPDHPEELLRHPSRRLSDPELLLRLPIGTNILQPQKDITDTIEIRELSKYCGAEML